MVMVEQVEPFALMRGALCLSVRASYGIESAEFVPNRICRTEVASDAEGLKPSRLATGYLYQVPLTA